MFISTSNPSFSLSFLFFCFFLHSSVATARLHLLTPLRIADASAEREFCGETRRCLADDSATSENTTLILAAERTHRKDPTDGFEKYSGGWNISSDHYWASVGFSAAPLYAISGAWFLVFGLTLLIVFLCYCCRQSELFGYSRTAYILSLIFLIFFTIAAIVGCAFLYTGQRKFHRTTRKTLSYVVDQAYDTSAKLRNMSGYLDAAKRIKVDSVTLPEEITSQIDNITRKINSSATTLSNEASSNSDRIRAVLEEIRFSLTILVAVIILLVILGWLSSVLGLKCILYFLVILGWILVTGTFILCGIFLHLHNVVADTCVAMDEWVQNPTAHTALDDILPCLDNATAHEIIPKTKEVTYQLVTLVNTIINNVTNKDVPQQAQAGPHYFNQSGPLMPTLCNPFNSDPAHSYRQCADDEASLNNASEVWKKYVCEASSSGMCRTPGRMNPDIYTQMTAAANVSHGLYRDGPFLVSLADCSFVREAFTNVKSTYCPGLSRYSEWIYIAAVVVAASVMMSLVFWIIYARERCHRVYNRLLTTELDQENVPPIN